MTMTEARIPTQVDEDRREAFDRHKFGMPRINWLYWRRHEFKRPDPDARWDWVEEDFKPKRKRKLKARKPSPERRETPEEYHYRTVVSAPRWRVIAMQVWHSLEINQEIEERPVPPGLMVNRDIYLAHIRQLMREWGIVSDEQFEVYREKLIRHALHRMGLL